MNNSTPKFNVLDIKCNGAGGYSNLVSDENKNVIKTYVSVYRNVEDFTELVSQMSKTDQSDRYFYGSRCSSDAIITERITTALGEYSFQKLQDNELAEMWINSQIEMLNGKDMTILVKEALRDCASADHWYDFEKTY